MIDTLPANQVCEKEQGHNTVPETLHSATTETTQKRLLSTAIFSNRILMQAAKTSPYHSDREEIYTKQYNDYTCF
jgi:hypothetical protein